MKLFEVYDRAHFPTVDVDTAQADQDRVPLPVYKGRKVQAASPSAENGVRRLGADMNWLHQRDYRVIPVDETRALLFLTGNHRLFEIGAGLGNRLSQSTAIANR